MSSSIHQEDLTKSKLNSYYYTGLFTKKTATKKRTERASRYRGRQPRSYKIYSRI